MSTFQGPKPLKLEPLSKPTVSYIADSSRILIRNVLNGYEPRLKPSLSPVNRGKDPKTKFDPQKQFPRSADVPSPSSSQSLEIIRNSLVKTPASEASIPHQADDTEEVIFTHATLATYFSQQERNYIENKIGNSLLQDIQILKDENGLLMEFINSIRQKNDAQSKNQNVLHTEYQWDTQTSDNNTNAELGVLKGNCFQREVLLKKIKILSDHLAQEKPETPTKTPQDDHSCREKMGEIGIAPRKQPISANSFLDQSVSKIDQDELTLFIDTLKQCIFNEKKSLEAKRQELNSKLEMLSHADGIDLVSPLSTVSRSDQVPQSRDGLQELKSLSEDLEHRVSILKKTSTTSSLSSQSLPSMYFQSHSLLDSLGRQDSAMTLVAPSDITEETALPNNKNHPNIADPEIDSSDWDLLFHEMESLETPLVFNPSEVHHKKVVTKELNSRETIRLRNELNALKSNISTRLPIMMKRPNRFT